MTLSTNAARFFMRLRDELITHRVSVTRLAANSLLIYVDAQPGDGRGLTIWLEPTWNFSSSTQVVAGSRQAQTEDPDKWEEIAKSFKVLIGQIIQDLDVDPVTFDLIISFEHGHVLKTFASDPECNELWHIQENATEKTLSASPRGFVIEDRN